MAAASCSMRDLSADDGLRLSAETLTFTPPALKKLRDKLGYDPIQTKVGQGYRLAGEETI